MRKLIRCLTVLAAGLLAQSAQPELVLVENGEARMPIVIFADAPPMTRQAADELAYYIEKTSGAKPEVLAGRPDPLPESAIWVGVQPAVRDLFPGQDFDFEHPGEILISANGKHLVIAGRDVWDPDHLEVPIRFSNTFDGFQHEYGTHNAVYTFIRDQLGVRWLWPGELGEDVPEQSTISFEPFTTRYHPQVLYRGGLMNWSALDRGVRGPDHEAMTPGGASGNFWLRAQRLQLSDWPSPGTCHGPWGQWWKRFHKTNPGFFALQPDGSRGGGERPFPSQGNIKMCFSNPDLWQQWLSDVEEQLRENPNLRVFNASPGDSFHQGHCICEECRAWDHPDGDPRRLHWQGLAQTYVALSDRDITFANTLAGLLKERFPEKELYVYMLAYGHSVPPPVAAVPADNVIVGNVANFLFRSDHIERFSLTGRTYREYFSGWGKLTNHHFWRPNIGAPVGIQWGMPDVPLRRTMEDFRFAADNGWMGIHVDYIRETWATQGPLYYLMAHLVWNPYDDGEAILKDYYARAFGPAAGEMEAYWNYMEAIREECYGTEQPGRADHDILDFYNTERLDKAAELIRAAEAALGGTDDRYRERIAFVNVGLEFTRLITDCGRLVRLVERHEDADGSARAQIHANWEQLSELREANPGAMRWGLFFGHRRNNYPPQTPRYAPTLWVP